jgi:ADP-heptose:LPS heptosyltransferase
MQEVKNILARLPNWLGDMVTSTAFIKALQQQYPTSAIVFKALIGKFDHP